MKKPSICAVVVNNDPEALKTVELLVDLFELRIDLIGEGWEEIALRFRKPWIACNRCTEEGGKGQADDAERVEKLFQAIELGAGFVDVELRTKNLAKIVPLIKKRARCILSFHDLVKTPPFNEMKEKVNRQLKAGADICKVVTTARSFEDNLSVLQLITAFPGQKLVTFAMGPVGAISRVLAPLAGAEFIYASIEAGRESAPGQITVRDLLSIYKIVEQ